MYVHRHLVLAYNTTYRSAVIITVLLLTACESNIPSATAASPAFKPAASIQVGPVLLDDEFNGTDVDGSKWGLGPRGDASVIAPYTTSESGCYASKQVSVSGGVAHFTAQSASSAGVSCGGLPNVTGILGTWNRERFGYGYFETRMRIPIAQGAWPVFWGRGDVWPSDLEFDVVEADSDGDACFNVHSTGNVHLTKNNCVPGFGSAFHTFGALVLPNGVTFYYDGKTVGHDSVTVPSRPRAIFVGQQVYRPLARSAIPRPFTTDVDYVRVWAAASQTSSSNSGQK